MSTDKTEARAILSQVKKSVSGWEKMARKIGISGGDIDLMHPAFRI